MKNQECQHDYNEHNGICRKCDHYSFDHDGIGQYYAEKDRQVEAEYKAWKDDPNPHKGSFNPKTYID